jgi:5'(3')-deoxyribonucleotidase
MTKAYYFDMDGVISNFHKDFDYRKRAQQALNREWIANLEVFEENVNLIKELIRNGELVYILTKAANEAARLGKIDWLEKYIPELTIEHFICIVGNGKKVDFIKEEGILIDDDMKNLRQWEKAGHEIYFVETKGAKVVF